jgi:hypothetical protein
MKNMQGIERGLTEGRQRQGLKHAQDIFEEAMKMSSSFFLSLNVIL